MTKNHFHTYRRANSTLEHLVEDPHFNMEHELMNREITIENKILIITYCFPPAAWVGAHRTLKYCKYLGNHNWTPVVLTAKTTGVTFKDENLLRQLPAHIQVHRTLDIDPAKWEAKLSEWKWKVLNLRASSGSSSQSRTVTHEMPHRAPGMWNQLKELLKVLVKESPDSHLFWVPFAFLKGVSILLKEKVDLIYCSSPPHSSHIIAFLLAKCFRKPYVLDFRDPWFVAGLPRQSPTKKPSWVSKFETFMKKAIVKKAAKVISATKGERDELRKEFPELKPDHFTFITNGYDPTDFGSVSVGKKPSSKLILTHAGTIYSGRGGEFFEALNQLIRNHPGIQSRMQVQLLGEIAYDYAETIRTLEASGILRTYGLQPHATALRLVMESDVLVILLGGNEDLTPHLPAKVFEYLHAGKPILAISREGELAEILKKSGLGILALPDDIGELAQTLWELCEDYDAGRLVRIPNDSYIRSFERSALTEQFAMILDEVKCDACTVCSRC